MSRLTSTLLVDGVELEDGSVEAVELAERLLREALDKLSEAKIVLGRVPDPVERHWNRLLGKAWAATDELTAQVSRFADDYRKRGLEDAVTDAIFRRDLPKP